MFSAEQKNNLGRAVARFSGSSVAKMERLLSGSAAVTVSGAQKRKLAKALAPARGCVKLLSAPHKDESQPDVMFAMADIKETLRYVAKSSPSFASYLARHAPTKPFRIALSHDETTGGNVLATEQRKKAILVYMAFMDGLMQPLHDSQHAWIPIACVAHFQIANVNGSLGMIHRLIIEDWSRQKLSDQFTVGNLQISLKLTLFIADMDGHRAALAAKGSAGLKPCAFCANCLSKDSQSTTERGEFFTIGESRIDVFEATTQEGLQAYIRRLIPEVGSMTKVDRDTLERCLGYNITPHSMWSSDICCAVLPLDRFINDQMHIYFSNGVCSLEINLWLAEVERVTKKNVQDIQAAVLAADWKRPQLLHKRGENRYWLKALFTPAYFKGSMYSGEAKRTRALMSILGWLTEGIWSQVPELSEKAQCFLRLVACVQHLKKLPECRDWQGLKNLQEAHHAAFVAAYPDYVRPKHHHRHHLPAQYERFDFIPTTWGTESKHKDYKSCYSANLQHLLQEERGGSQFSMSLLPRLILRHCELVNEHPFAVDGYLLETPFPAAEVERETGLTDIELSSHCRVGVLNIKEGDVLVWGAETPNAGEIHFFIVHQQSLFVYVSALELVTTKQTLLTFKAAGHKMMLKWSQLRCPSTCTWWQKTTENEFLLLP